MNIIILFWRSPWVLVSLSFPCFSLLLFSQPLAQFLYFVKWFGRNQLFLALLRFSFYLSIRSSPDTSPLNCAVHTVFTCTSTCTPLRDMESRSHKCIFRVGTAKMITILRAQDCFLAGANRQMLKCRCNAIFIRNKPSSHSYTSLAFI